MHFRSSPAVSFGIALVVIFDLAAMIGENSPRPLSSTTTKAAPSIRTPKAAAISTQ
jgi:hypothetical protein